MTVNIALLCQLQKLHAPFVGSRTRNGSPNMYHPVSLGLVRQRLVKKRKSTLKPAIFTVVSDAGVFSAVNTIIHCVTRKRSDGGGRKNGWNVPNADQ